MLWWRVTPPEGVLPHSKRFGVQDTILRSRMQVRLTTHVSVRTIVVVQRSDSGRLLVNDCLPRSLNVDCRNGGTCEFAGSLTSTVCNCKKGSSGGDCSQLSGSGGQGDPHFTTMDTNYFSFYEHGQFWGCKSPNSDFGYQLRLFAAPPVGECQ
jgi:hypothetical protein